MLRRFLVGGFIAALGAAGCRGEKKEAPASCTVVERTVREVGGALEVAVAARWTVKGTNYRHNKPVTIGRFDARQGEKAALEERYRPGAEVPCSIDPARPTRVELHGDPR